MNTAQPDSLPPGDRWSAGMNRSTIASTVATSLALKKYQPSGLTGLGGSPAKGDQGSLPEMVSPSAAAARIGTKAAVARRRRRLKTWRICSPTCDSVLFGTDPMRRFRRDQFGLDFAP